MQFLTCPSLVVESVGSSQLLHADRNHQTAAGESQALQVDRAANAASKASSDQEQGAEAAHSVRLDFSSAKQIGRHAFLLLDQSRNDSIKKARR